MTVVNFLARFDLYLTKLKSPMYSVFPSQAMLPRTKNPFYPETGDICLNTGSLFFLLGRGYETSTVALSWLCAYPFVVIFCCVKSLTLHLLMNGLPKAAKKFNFFINFSLTENEISHIHA